jgi:hypothetical protein
VLRPGGRLGISDVLADLDTSPAQRARAELDVGCLAGTLTQGEYEHLLEEAGFFSITIRSTSQAADGLVAAVIGATKPNRG